mgnify:CR=1 FL=1
MLANYLKLFPTIHIDSNWFFTKYNSMMTCFVKKSKVEREILLRILSRALEKLNGLCSQYVSKDSMV